MEGGSMQVLFRRLAPRTNVLLGAIDQAVSSGTNFIAVLLAASALSADDFGRFSMVYVLYTIILGATQAAVSQELVLYRGENEASMLRVRAGLRASIMAGVATSVVLLVVALFLPQWSSLLQVLALGLPLLLAQDVARHGAALLRVSQIALLLDLIWITVLVLGWAALALLSNHADSAAVISAVWYGAGVVSGVFGVLLFRITSRDGFSVALYFDRRFLGYRFLAEFTVVRGVSQALGIVVGFMSTVAAAGAFRAATTLYGPMNVLVTATSTFALPVLARREKQLRRMLFFLALGLAVTSTASVLLLWSLPDSVGERLLGETWAGTRILILPFGVQILALSISTVYFMGLRIKVPRATLPLRVAVSCLTVVLFFGGFLVAAAEGAAWGLALAAVGNATIGYVAFRRQDSEPRPSPV